MADIAKYCTFLCTIILFSCPISPQENLNKILLLENPILHLSEMSKGTSIDTFFLIQNISEGTDVIIFDIESSCYCTTLKTNKLTIKAGEKKKVNFYFRADNFGRFQQIISLNTNLSKQKLIQIIRGKVILE